MTSESRVFILTRRLRPNLVKRKKEPRNEFEEPPHTKIRVVATIEKALFSELVLIHDEEVKNAESTDRVPPDWSNTVEMIVRKGLKAFRKDRAPQPMA